MSQHFCDITLDNRRLRVLLGYDRRLNYLFCVVERLDTSADTERYLYSNLDDPKAGLSIQDVGYFERVLNTLGVTIPAQMYTGVANDQRARAGNFQLQHYVDGSSQLIT